MGDSIKITKNIKFDNNKKRLLKKSILTLLSVFFVVVFTLCIGVASMYGSAFSNEKKMYQKQIKRIENLKTNYENGKFDKIDEQNFCSFDISNSSNIRFNDMKFLATHNSYKSKENNSAKILNGFASLVSGNGANGFSYFFDSLTEQFNNGIRSIELDAFPMNDGKFKICHHAVTDTNSSAIDFELALQEIYLWSQYNPNHMPITILLEAKNWMGLHRADGHDFELCDFQNMDEQIRKVLKDKLISPKDVLAMNGKFETFGDMRKNNAWPKLNDMLGKVMVVLHPGDGTKEYISQDTKMQEQAMFPAIGDKREELKSLADYTGFVLCNEPIEEKDAIAYYSNQNFVVRTRIDIFPKYSEQRTKACLDGLANLISTDFPPSKNNQLGYTRKVFLDDNKHTITLK